MWKGCGWVDGCGGEIWRLYYSLHNYSLLFVTGRWISEFVQHHCYILSYFNLGGESGVCTRLFVPHHCYILSYFKLGAGGEKLSLYLEC